MSKGKWITSTNEEFWSGGAEEYNTKEEAIAAAGNDHALESGQKFWVGRIGEYKPIVDADVVIEHMAEQALDEHGEVAEGWMDTIPGDQVIELEKALTETWNLWADKHGYQPKFFPLEDVSEHVWEEK